MFRTPRTARILWLLLLAAGVISRSGIAPAQDQGQTQGEGNQGEDTSQRLHYLDESTPENNLVVDLNGLTGYDDNVFGDNSNRVGSTLFQVGGHVGLSEVYGHSSLSLDYVPEFLFYDHAQGYNQVNQDFRFKGKYDFTRHLDLRVFDTVNYFTGISSPTLNNDLTFQSGPVPSLNSTVIYPLAREFSDEGRVDIDYQASRRSSFDFFGTAGVRNMAAVSDPEAYLLNTQEFSGGMAYTYRTTASTTVGVMGMHQNLRFGPSLDTVDTGFFTFAWQGHSHLSLNLFGGPQLLHFNDAFPSSLVEPGASGSSLTRAQGEKWDGGGGVTLAWQSPRTVVMLSGQRLASDGGGFFTSVINSVENFDVRRRLSRYWDLLLTGENSESKTTSSLFRGAGLTDQTGTVNFERQLSNNLVAQVGYEAARQRIIGTFPFLVNMNRNYVTLGFFYRVASRPLGRR